MSATNFDLYEQARDACVTQYERDCLRQHLLVYCLRSIPRKVFKAALEAAPRPVTTAAQVQALQTLGEVINHE